MSEFLSQQSSERLQEIALQRLVEQYLPEDAEFLSDMDINDALGYVYGQLLEAGEDPDIILKDFGVTEESRNDEV